MIFSFEGHATKLTVLLFKSVTNCKCASRRSRSVVAELPQMCRQQRPCRRTVLQCRTCAARSAACPGLLMAVQPDLRVMAICPLQTQGVTAASCGGAGQS